MFIGNVIASAIGKYKPGLALGTVIFIATGVAICEALAVKTANTNGKIPNEKNAFNFLPLVMLISRRKIARNPLTKSFVNGLMPSACFALARKPITKLLELIKHCH